MNKWPVCPMSGLACKGDGCAWFCEEERRCAVALIPGQMDWLIRFSVTKPYEKEAPEE